MKFLFFLAVLFSISVNGLLAQKISVGAEGGFNLSGAIVKDPGADPKGSPLPGFQIGGYASMSLPSPSFSVAARLVFSNEGYHTDIYDTKSDIHVNFIKIPLNFVYQPGTASKFFVGLGPYFAFGVGGHYTSMESKVKIYFGSNGDKDELKSLDLGADVMAGYKINEKILIRASFDIGVINYLTPGSTADASAHTLNFGLTGAYLLWSK